MASRTSWSNLYPGLIALAALTALAVVVLRYGAVGRVRGDTLRLHVVTDQARGVMAGTEVWLEGRRVGVVTDIGFRPPSADTLRRVVISVDVRARDAGQIRRDSDVRVRTGANLVGPIVVYIATGTPQSPGVADGDTLVASPQSDVQNTLARAGDAATELAPLMQDARAIMAHVENRRGTVGALLGTRGGPELARLRAGVAQLQDALGGTGSARAAVVARARVALARADSVRTLVASDEASLGRFRRDSTLAGAIASVRDELATMRARMDAGGGTLHRLSADSAITIALADARREMALLFEDVRKRPLRYIAF